eukprot:5959095-Alexandrium_andersonii.AAC.1
MSASLVGSEMCIRDRLQPPKNTLGLGSVPACGRERSICGPMEDARGPVSYTHLTLPTICSV